MYFWIVYPYLSTNDLSTYIYSMQNKSHLNKNMRTSMHYDLGETHILTHQFRNALAKTIKHFCTNKNFIDGIRFQPNNSMFVIYMKMPLKVCQIVEQINFVVVLENKQKGINCYSHLCSWFQIVSLSGSQFVILFVLLESKGTKHRWSLPSTSIKCTCHLLSCFEFEVCEYNLTETK